MQAQPLSSFISENAFPQRGVYFFREPGELRPGSTKDLRIVRVGTHAVSVGAKSTLWQRLRTHRGTRAGGGNHRASIFRRHVGAALLAQSGGELPSWGEGSTVPASVKADPVALAAESELEQRVSRHIGGMNFLFVSVPDTPGPSSARSLIEKNAIGLLSNSLAPLEGPSPAWLGRYSPRTEIRMSALWNLDYLDCVYDPHFLEVLQEAVTSTLRSEKKSAV